MTLNIIYDDRRPEKWEPLMNELSRQGIHDYKIWEPVPDTRSVVASINKSHKQIVKWAKENGLKEVCIGEDDLMFPAEDGWEYFLRKKPNDYELYLACSYGGVTEKQTIGFHLYCVHEKFYDKFLSVQDETHIDTAMWWLGKDEFVFCYPFAALQRPGYSHNNKTDVNYNKILKPEDVHGAIYNI
jgi:hypothetical protein